MILSLLLTIQEAAPASAPSEDEIVVIASKMRLIEVDIKAPRRHGKLVLERCRVTSPTGYAEIDDILCTTARECMLDEPSSRKQLANCVEERSQPRLDAVVAAWRARR